MPQRMVATQDGVCSRCGEPIKRGDTIVHQRKRGVFSKWHMDCTTWRPHYKQPLVIWHANIK